MEHVHATLRTVARRLTSVAHLSRPVAFEDEANMALEFDRARGYQAPAADRSKSAHALSGSLPVVEWSPPSVRQHRV